MGEFLIELLGQFIAEMIPSFLKGIGASIKWLVYLGKRPFSEVLDEEWNTRIGMGIVFLILSVVIKLSYWSN